MNVDLAIRGSLAKLPGDEVGEASLRDELQQHGMTPEDADLALERAVLDGYVARAAGGRLTKLPRAFLAAQPGALPQP